MPDSSVAADPLALGMAVPRSVRCEKKVVLISLVIGLTFAVVWSGSQVPGIRGGAEEDAVTMAGALPQSAASARVRQFLQPMKVWQPTQPLRTPTFRQSPVAAAASDEQRASSDLMPYDSESQVMSRRAALASGFLAASMIPQAAWAVNRKRGVDDPEAELERLQQEQKEKAEKKKLKEQKLAGMTEKEKAEEEAEKGFPIAAALGGGVVLSVPLYFANLQRLGTKVASGGKDDGYGKGKTKKGQAKRR